MRVVYTPRYMMPTEEPGRLTEPDRDLLAAKAIIAAMEETGRERVPLPKIDSCAADDILATRKRRIWLAVVFVIAWAILLTAPQWGPIVDSWRMK